MSRLFTCGIILGFVACSLAWETSVNLGEPINTVYNEWFPVFPDDGSYMLFVSDNPQGMGGMDIWISYSNGDEWGTPENLGPSVNTPYDESAPSLAENDTVLYFLSTDPSGYGQGDVWFCDFNAGIPGAKTNMGPPINTAYYDCCPLMSHSGDRFYICSDRPGGEGDIDIWISERTGDEWGQPYNAGSEVNTQGHDSPRWISDSDQHIVALSSGPGGYGAADLYSLTVSGDTLTARTNLGSVINTSSTELGPGFLNNSGMIAGTIYYGSGRPGGSGGMDIWCSESTQALEPLSWAGIKASFTLPATPCEAKAECR